MAAQIITKEDLDQFGIELLAELKSLLSRQNKSTPKKWLKSFEVRKLLGISHGTLQNMRVTGVLPYTKVGGIIFYNNDDIQRMLMENHSSNKGN